MYVDQIKIEHFRTFWKQREPITFCHPQQDWKALGFADAPRLKNVTLVLGNNGAGKTTLLKAVALACLGPAVGDSGLFPYRLIRREPGKAVSEPRRAVKKGPSQPGAVLQDLREAETPAIIEARVTPHSQDTAGPGEEKLVSKVQVTSKGDIERLEWRGSDAGWLSIFKEDDWAFFFVGYGATRRVESRERFDSAARKSRSFFRAQRVMGLFEDSYSLVPLNAWLPALRDTNKSRHDEVIGLINRIMKGDHYQFTAARESGGEYLFSRKGLQVPYPALSDGYRAFLGWLGDLLYHLAIHCPPHKRLVDNRGIVMVDEIDLHLHPKWQMNVLPTLAKALPMIQFIVTSHSPLVVGSLEWMNILVMKPGPKCSSRAERLDEAVHGLDADQVLLTDFFGLESTRAGVKDRQMKSLALEARAGNSAAAMKLLNVWSRGLEGKRA